MAIAPDDSRSSGDPTPVLNAPSRVGFVGRTCLVFRFFLAVSGSRSRKPHLCLQRDTGQLHPRVARARKIPQTIRNSETTRTLLHQPAAPRRLKQSVRTKLDGRWRIDQQQASPRSAEGPRLPCLTASQTSCYSWPPPATAPAGRGMVAQRL